ncbi:GAF and ANTAR domain-containing protein [Umezawaea sp. Da 62-37]|uniref:GAF and ANTAR domain-containing protein n=1 Tax=Umezawaea sp. Da 62-37 TaxID=3075927 RepID=UPI0028F725FB|nr:GAF and ANTAR domain-containing protein [Umezawaea sp. Da 62-37]WNV84778.1 GAF and ANTAR domain-containing protein [Umezawaea sp. Da 62-37]
MAGRPNGADRLAQVHAWAAARAGDLGVPVTVRLLCDTAVSRLGVSGATVTMGITRGLPEMRCSTDMLGEHLAELQVTVGEGPSTDSWRAGGPVLAADLDSPEAQRRWPLFTPLAVEAGARALFAFPLVVGAIRGGMLTFHRVESGPLDQTALRNALAFARMALGLVLAEQAGLRDADDALPLHNPQLHQATGMVSAQLRVGVDEAFVRLRGHAFATGRPLAELAADVVARRVLFAPDQEAT